MSKKLQTPTYKKARNWVAIDAHFRRSGVTDRESQDGKCKKGWNTKKERRKSKVDLRAYKNR